MARLFEEAQDKADAVGTVQRNVGINHDPFSLGFVSRHIFKKKRVKPKKKHI